jgi:hypothetical protein
VKSSDVIVKREQVRLRFKDEEMDFMFNWVLGIGEIIGLSQGEMFYAIAGIKDGIRSAGLETRLQCPDGGSTWLGQNARARPAFSR